MKHFCVSGLSATVVFLLTVSSRAENPPVGVVLDKAIKAIGGEDKLSKAHAVTWKTKAKVTIEGNENEMKIEGTLQGLDHYRSEFEGDFNGNVFKGLTVISGDKGWRKFGGMVMELDQDALKNEKRTIYLVASHLTLLPLKGKDFKVELAADSDVQGKPATALKITGPDGKEATLYFDKESGIPVRQVARVTGWMGEEYTQESTFSDYKEFDGIKVATKVTTKRDGEDFVKQEITEVKFTDKAPADAFAEPK
jgi:hypothetical protein